MLRSVGEAKLRASTLAQPMDQFGYSFNYITKSTMAVDVQNLACSHSAFVTLHMQCWVFVNLSIYPFLCRGYWSSFQWPTDAISDCMNVATSFLVTAVTYSWWFFGIVSVTTVNIFFVSDQKFANITEWISFQQLFQMAKSSITVRSIQVWSMATFLSQIFHKVV